MATAARSAVPTALAAVTTEAAGAAAAAADSTAAVALPRVTVKMRFAPDRIGRSTTIHYAFTVSQPAPLRSVALRLPPGIGFATTSLGIEACLPDQLLGAGPDGCPGNSVIGFGAALAEVPARTTVEERVKVGVFMGPAPSPPASAGQTMTVLFFLDGKWPVQREVVMSARLLNIAGAGGAKLVTEAPPLSVWPGGPDVGLTRFHATIGPEGLTYRRRIGSRWVDFKPRGVTVPNRCPRGGFPVRASFRWWHMEGTSVAESHVPCPRRRPSSRRHALRG